MSSITTFSPRSPESFSWVILTSRCLTLTPELAIVPDSRGVPG